MGRVLPQESGGAFPCLGEGKEGEDRGPGTVEDTLSTIGPRRRNTLFSPAKCYERIRDHFTGNIRIQRR